MTTTHIDATKSLKWLLAVLCVCMAASSAEAQVIVLRPLSTDFVVYTDNVDSDGYFDDQAAADYWSVAVVPGQTLTVEVDRQELAFDPFVWVFAGTIADLGHFDLGGNEYIDALDVGFLGFADDGVVPAASNGTQDPRIVVTIPAGVTTCTVLVTSFLSGIEVNGVYESGDGGDGQYGYSIRASAVTLAPPSVRATHLFYNNSAWDGNEVAATPADDAAIATDKAAAYRAGTGLAATYAHYSNYSRGLNGLMIDVVNLPGSPTADDFEFKVGNSNSLATWEHPSSTVLASVAVRRGAGVDGSDRITIVFADNAIRNQWLQVRMLNTAETGVGDVHYWGHQTAETNTPSMAGSAVVDLSDLVGVRDHRRSALNPAPIDFIFDLDRDKRVDLSDFVIARDNPVGALKALKLVTIP